MAKSSGGTRGSSWRDKKSADEKDIQQLINSKNIWISAGMNRLEDNLARGDDYSDMSNLTMNEKRVVTAYLTHAYHIVNDTLRGTESNSDALLLANKLDSALKKLNTYHGQTVRSVGFKGRKGAKEASEFASQFKPGEKVTFKEFLSTGTNESKIKRKFKEESNVIFKIKSKNGRDLRRYNDEEREILFRRGTSFKVISRRGLNITLEEIS